MLKLTTIAAAVATLIAAAVVSATVEVVGSTNVAFSWTAASGPVVGYNVWIIRNGGTEQMNSVIDDTSETIYGQYGGNVQISVEAFDAEGNVGPRSEWSEDVTFVAATPTPTATPTATPTPTPTPTAVPLGQPGRPQIVF